MKLSRASLAAPWTLGLFTLACDDPAATPKAPDRADVVLAAPGATPASSDPASSHSAADSAGPNSATKKVPVAARRGPLCASSPRVALPDMKVGGSSAHGAAAFSGGKPTRGKLVWVNLWAAWCEPCKKELPLLRQFLSKWKAEGLDVELAFFSVDDDQRQLQRFLDNEPSDGLKKTYWLREGNEREEWLASATLAAEPRLPVHLLVGADGKIFCRVDGSIEAEDYASATAALREHR